MTATSALRGHRANTPYVTGQCHVGRCRECRGRDDSPSMGKPWVCGCPCHSEPEQPVGEIPALPDGFQPPLTRADVAQRVRAGAAWAERIGGAGHIADALWKAAEWLEDGDA